MGSRTHFKTAVEGCREIGHWEEGIGIVSRMELLQQFSVLTGGGLQRVRSWGFWTE